MSEAQAKKEVQPKEAPSEKPQGDKSTLIDLAKRNGQLIVRDPRVTRFYAQDPHESPFKATHQVADVRHGWRLHENTKHEQVLLTDADYLAALEASKLGKVHEPANRRDPELAAKQQASREAAAKKGA